MLLLLQEVVFQTYDGYVDKPRGTKFTVTPATWNSVTPEGVERRINFQLLDEDDQSAEDVTLVSMIINGGREIRFEFD